MKEPCQFLRVYIGGDRFRVVSYKIVRRIHVYETVMKSAAFKLVGDDNEVYAIMRVNTNKFRSELRHVQLTDIAPNKRHAAIVTHARALAMAAEENQSGMRMGDL